MKKYLLLSSTAFLAAFVSFTSMSNAMDDEQPGPHSLQGLPLEIQNQIFNNLTLKDMGNVAQVNKGLNSASENDNHWINRTQMDLPYAPVKPDGMSWKEHYKNTPGVLPAIQAELDADEVQDITDSLSICFESEIAGITQGIINTANAKGDDVVQQATILFNLTTAHDLEARILGGDDNYISYQDVLDAGSATIKAVVAKIKELWISMHPDQAAAFTD